MRQNEIKQEFGRVERHTTGIGTRQNDTQQELGRVKTTYDRKQCFQHHVMRTHAETTGDAVRCTQSFKTNYYTLISITLMKVCPSKFSKRRTLKF